MTGPFTAAPHHEVLVLLVQVAVLLFAARAMGEIAQRLRQPSVVGEILAGIVLGPSLLSGAFPALGAWVVPHPGVPGYLLETISLIGALFLLLITGLETDLALIRRHARTAIGVSLGGIAVTFSSGFLLGQWLPDRLLADPGERLVFALFVATALSISAIPVIAKVLMDMNLMRRDVGQTIIAAGMSDDTIGWILLSVVAGLASSGAVTAGSVLQAVGSVVAFMVVSFTAGRWLVKRLLDYVQDEVRSTDRLVTLVVGLTFAWGAVTQALNLEAVLGAFVMGILFGQMPRLPEEVHHKVVTIALAVFTPIFFATAGLKVNARSLADPELLLLTLAVIGVATGGKVAGTYLGARLVGRRDHWTALSFGAGLNARGAMEIIIATIGLELGILSQDMFSIIVIMAMATSLMAPPALRWVLARVTPGAEEMARLQREEREAASAVARIHRVLVPVRVRPRADADAVHRVEAWLAARLAARGPLSLTLLSVTRPGGRGAGTAFLEALGGEFAGVELTRKVVEAPQSEPAILEEAQKDYQLMVIGATESRARGETLFHPVVDQLVRMAPCPTLVVSGAHAEEHWPPRRMLVPTNGSAESRRAAELAFALAGEGGEVVVLNVVQKRAGPYHLGLRGEPERQMDTARQIVDELVRLGEGSEAAVRGEIRAGPDPDTTVLEFARQEGVDVLVLGTNIRPASERLFLGPRVEHMLHGAPCPVLVFNGA